MISWGLKFGCERPGDEDCERDVEDVWFDELREEVLVEEVLVRTLLRVGLIEPVLDELFLISSSEGILKSAAKKF